MIYLCNLHFIFSSLSLLDVFNRLLGKFLLFLINFSVSPQHSDVFFFGGKLIRIKHLFFSFLLQFGFQSFIFYDNRLTFLLSSQFLCFSQVFSNKNSQYLKFKQKLFVFFIELFLLVLLISCLSFFGSFFEHLLVK